MVQTLVFRGCDRKYSYGLCDGNHIFIKLQTHKNVDIKFSAHDACLEYPISGTLKIKILESQISLWENDN